MVKKRSKNRAVAAAMDTDEPSPSGGAWTTAPIAEVEPEAMETGDDYVPVSEPAPRKGGGKKAKLSARLPDMGMKPTALKRGQRSTNQRRRKAGKLAKAVAVADRRQTKLGKAAGTRQRKVALKSLWVTGGLKTSLPEV